MPLRGAQFILTSHARRFLRSPPSPHRIFAARWRGADEGADEKGGGIRDAGGRDHRSRQSLRRDRILPGSERRRDQADHRLRGLHGAAARIKDRPNSQRDAAYHFTLLAQDETGYRNLVKLISTAHLDGISLQAADRQGTARAHMPQGLIGMSGCLKGEINMAIQADKLDKARQSAAEFRDILGAENFFLEMHDHGIEAQQQMQRGAAGDRAGIRPRTGRGERRAFSRAQPSRSARRHDLHRHRQDGARRTADALRAGALFQIAGRNARALPGSSGGDHEHARDRRALQSRARVRDFEISRIPGAGRARRAKHICANFATRVCASAIGERATTDPELHQAPRLRTRRPREDRVRQLFPDRLGFHPFRESSAAFRSARAAVRRPVRSSPTCSGLPISIRCKFGLLFERFLNPERVSPPDIDVDFCEARRGEVLEYVRQKYGERRVSQIITFGKLKAKSVVRDVGRVIGLELRRCGPASRR